MLPGQKVRLAGRSRSLCRSVNQHRVRALHHRAARRPQLRDQVLQGGAERQCRAARQPQAKATSNSHQRRRRRRDGRCGSEHRVQPDVRASVGCRSAEDDSRSADVLRPGCVLSEQEDQASVVEREEAVAARLAWIRGAEQRADALQRDRRRAAHNLALVAQLQTRRVVHLNEPQRLAARLEAQVHAVGGQAQQDVCVGVLAHLGVNAAERLGVVCGQRQHLADRHAQHELAEANPRHQVQRQHAAR